MYDPDPDEDGRDYWQEYKDDRAMGPPREEPDEPPPLDLDEVQELLDQIADADRAGGLGDAEQRLYNIAPELLARLRRAEGELERLHDMPRTYEYAITDGAPPEADTPRVTRRAAEAEAEEGTAGRAVWTQAHIADGWHHLELPPF